MGAITESSILTQAKKGQGETNARLDLLIAEERRTNQLLGWIGYILQANAPAGVELSTSDGL